MYIYSTPSARDIMVHMTVSRREVGYIVPSKAVDNVDGAS